MEHILKLDLYTLYYTILKIDRDWSLMTLCQYG